MTNTTWLLLGDVARRLRCRPHQIVYLLTSRQVPEPATRIGNRRMFTPADVETIKSILNNKKGHDE
jgi:DNA-binding transcriptional MerR regulator